MKLPFFINVFPIVRSDNPARNSDTSRQRCDYTVNKRREKKSNFELPKFNHISPPSDFFASLMIKGTIVDFHKRLCCASESHFLAATRATAITPTCATRRVSCKAALTPPWPTSTLKFVTESFSVNRKKEEMQIFVRFRLWYHLKSRESCKFALTNWRLGLQRIFNATKINEWQIFKKCSSRDLF